MQDGIRLAGPARELPWSSRARCLFGGFYSQFGWLWLGLSSIHFRLFLFEFPKEAPLPAAVMISLFPLIGLVFIGVGLRRGLRALRLLRRGIPATGRLVARERTNVTINDRPVVRLTFEFKTVDGRTARAATETHLVENLSDGAGEDLLYDPEDPAAAVFLDDLPGKPRVGDDGVVVGSEGWAWLLLAVPAGTVLLHVVWTVLAR